jgi:hypothetical protein
MSDDEPAAILAYYRKRGEREIAAARDVVTRHSGENVLILVAAVEAALNLHQPHVRRQNWPPVCSYDNRRWPCPEVAAITTALGGTEAGE